MILPGIALNFGSARSKIRVRIGQIEVTAIVATEVNSREVTVAYSADSNTYLVWGNSAPRGTGLERKLVKRQRPKRVKKKEKNLYPFKILLYFYSTNSDLEYYLKGGDKTLIPLTSILEGLGVDIISFGVIDFINVGKKEKDWILIYQDEINNRLITYDNRTKESTILNIDPSAINNSRYIGNGVLRSYYVNNLDFNYSNSAVISDSQYNYTDKIQYYQLHYTLHSDELINGENITFNRSLSHIDIGNNEFLPTRTFDYQETSTSNRNLNIVVLDTDSRIINGITFTKRLISEEFTDTLSFNSSLTITTDEKSTFYFYNQLIEGTREKVRTLTESGDFNSSWKEVAIEEREEGQEEWEIISGVFHPSQTYELNGSSTIGTGTEVYSDRLVINYSFRGIDFIYSEIYTENNNYSNNISTNPSNQPQPVLTGDLQQEVFDSNTIDNDVKASFTTSRNKLFIRNGTVDIEKDDVLLVTSEYVFWKHEEQNVSYTDRWEVDQINTYVKEVAYESSLSRERPDSVSFAGELYNGEFDFIGLRIYDINNHEDTEVINSFPLSRGFFSNSFSTLTAFERFIDLSGYNFKGFTRTVNNCSFKGVRYSLNNLPNREKACRFDFFQFDNFYTQKTIYYKKNGEDKVKWNFDDAFLCDVRDVFINEVGDYNLEVSNFYAGLDSDLIYFDWANSSSRTRDETELYGLFTTSDYENITRWTDPKFTAFWSSIIGRTDITIISYDRNDRESINVCTGRINVLNYIDRDRKTYFKRDVDTINITVETIKKESIFTYRNQDWDSYTMTHVFSHNCNILVYEAIKESSLKRWFNMVGDKIYLARHIYDRDNIDRFSESTENNFVDVYKLNNGVFTRLPNLKSKKQNISQTVVGGGYLTNPYVSYYPPKRRG